MDLRYSPSRIAGFLVLLSAFIYSGCTKEVLRERTTQPQAQVEPDEEKIDRILDWLEVWSRSAQSIKAEGSMTISNAETQQSGEFTLKTKRLKLIDATTSARIDSVSLEARGPFGITAVRFLASPQYYALYNMLMGETLEGPTNDQALEGLTQLRGISLETMNDVTFGLPPSPEGIDPQDSILLLSRGTAQHIMLVYRFHDNYTEALTFDGAIPDGSAPILLDQLHLTRYERWNGKRMTYTAANPKTQATIVYSNIGTKKNVPFADKIEVITGPNKLLLEYETVDYNPQDLKVYINVPGRKR
jgi:hypothetical protein